MIRELWSRHMDGRRALSLALLVVAYGLLVLALAAMPNFAGSSAQMGWLAWSAPALGAILGTASGGYLRHRRPGTRDGLRWGLAQGGLMLLVILGLYALAAAINPIVSANPTFGGDAWAGLLAAGTIGAGTSAVLWERERHRRRIAAVLLAATCLVIAGIVGLRAGGLGTPIGTVFLLAGILGVAAGALQGLSNLARETARPAT